MLVPESSHSQLSSAAVYLPARLTTPEYGNRWGHMPSELKVVVKPIGGNIQSLEVLVETLTRSVGLHHIESIPKTNEVSIAC